MPPRRFRVAKAAQADLRTIGRYSRPRWGVERSNRYLFDLNACFQRLAEDPSLGRAHSDRYLRFEHVSHVVFFRRARNGNIVVVRILHKRMLPEQHLNKP